MPDHGKAVAAFKDVAPGQEANYPEQVEPADQFDILSLCYASPPQRLGNGTWIPSDRMLPIMNELSAQILDEYSEPMCDNSLAGPLLEDLSEIEDHCWIDAL